MPVPPRPDYADKTFVETVFDESDKEPHHGEANVCAKHLRDRELTWVSTRALRNLAKAYLDLLRLEEQRAEIHERTVTLPRPL
jgi:hypothetical protein